VSRIEFREDLAEIVRSIGELDKERRKQAAGILLCTISEIEIKEGECGQSSLRNVPNLFDDCRTDDSVSAPEKYTVPR
jgi:hypothetical protein